MLLQYPEWTLESLKLLLLMFKVIEKRKKNPTQLVPLTVRGGDGDGHVDVGSVFWPLAPSSGAWVGVPPSTHPDVSVLESRRCTATKMQTGTYV